MEDLKLIEAVERYITGSMNPDERVYFEQLRKTNPEIDQMVVEHTFFLQQLNRFDEGKKLRSLLNETHTDLAEEGVIQSPRLRGRARVVYLFNRYKRTAAIAASIAGITALTFSALVWSISPGKPISDVQQEMTNLVKKVNRVEQQNKALDQKIANVADNVAIKEEQTPSIQYTGNGTGFLVDPKGYVVTNHHVVENAKNIAVQSGNGKEFPATIVYTNKEQDIAILKIQSKEFKAASVPYSINKGSARLAESIYTLGYPRNVVVYGEGYVAARTGNKGDSLALQVTIAANPGNSGGPVLNRKGEVIGIISKKQNNTEGAVFAVQSKYIYQALQQLQKDSLHKNLKIPSTPSLKTSDRTQQVEKISDYVYMVKVN